MRILILMLLTLLIVGCEYESNNDDSPITMPSPENGNGTDVPFDI